MLAPKDSQAEIHQEEESKKDGPSSLGRLLDKEEICAEEK
jgi:hypothetical protein